MGRARVFFERTNKAVFFPSVRLSLLLGLFAVFDYGLNQITHPDKSDLDNSFLVASIFQKHSWQVLLLSSLTAMLSLYFGRFWKKWNDLDKGVALRGFITFIVLVFAVSYAIHGYNFYFDQGYYPDRILLVVLAVLVYWRPIFIFAFMLVLLPLIWQWNQPLGGYIPGTIYHAVQALVLFCSWFLLTAFSHKSKASDYLFLLCVMAASVYWLPGLLKFKMDWYTHDQIHYMPLAAYAHGWLAFLDVKDLVGFINLIMPYEKALHGLVYVFELGAIVWLWHRKLFMALLLIATVFHLGVLVTYGYMLWAWVIFDISLLLLLIRIGPLPDLFTRLQFVLSIALILSSSYWLSPPRLAWYNTPLTSVYTYQVIGESEKQYNLSPRFFSPYGDIMTMGLFRDISPGPRLVGPYGITLNLDILQALRSIKDVKEIFILEQQLGSNEFDKVKSQKIVDFITEYLKHYNVALKEKLKWHHFTCCNTPPQFWSLDSDNMYKGQEPVKEVIIHEVTRFFDGKELKTIRNLELLALDIP